MGNNIFKGAKFGDKFVTRYNKIAIFSHVNNGDVYLMYPHYYLNGEQDYLHYDYVNFKGFYREDGVEDDKDIISRYQESIDENKLDKLAKDWDNHNTKKQLVDGYGSELATLDSVIDAYKAGYRKALKQ